MVDMATKLEHTVSYRSARPPPGEVVTTETVLAGSADAMNHDKGAGVVLTTATPSP